MLVNQRKMRVLFLSYAAYPLFNPEAVGVHGGAELDLFNIATHLNKDKFEIHFVVGDYGQPDHEEINGVYLHTAQKIKNAFLVAGFLNFTSLFFLIKRVNPDVIVTKSLGWLTVETILTKIILRKKMIFRSSHRRNIDGYVDSKLYGKFFRGLINQIDHFLVQNGSDKKILLDTYHFKNPVTHIPNLHPIEKKEPLPLSKRKNILWVGRCEIIKNPGAFLELARLNPQQSFQMILLDTNSQLYDEIQSQAKKIPNISISGKVPRDKIHRFFSEAKYLVITSSGEGFPNVLIEALAQGTPIISLRIDFDNLLSIDTVGYLGDGSVPSISYFINSTPDSTWINLSINAHKLALERFSIERGISAYENILSKLQ